MFNLKKENSRILKGIVEALGAIADETEFKITPTGLIVSAMDPSKICLLRLELKKEHFTEYDCKKEAKICLNLQDFDKILKRSTTNDSIELSFQDKEQKIKVSMKRNDGSSRKRTFSLALLQSDAEEIPMDNLLKIDYPSKWVSDPDFLIEAIKDAEIYSEILNARAEEGKGLTFNSAGQIGEMNYEIELTELLESIIAGTNTGAYAINFLKSILKLSTITEKLEVSLKTDHPFKLKFNLLEGGELYYFLAPRVPEADFSEDKDEILVSEKLETELEKEEPEPKAQTEPEQEEITSGE